jgi:hypothetical protein
MILQSRRIMKKMMMSWMTKTSVEVPNEEARPERRPLEGEVFKEA